MIKLAISKWKVLTKKSIVIGDRETDMLMAKRANLRSYMVNERTNLLRVVKQFHNIAK
jgi:histidinol phosphatase-like enzyme